MGEERPARQARGFSARWQRHPAREPVINEGWGRRRRRVPRSWKIAGRCGVPLAFPRSIDAWRLTGKGPPPAGDPSVRVLLPSLKKHARASGGQVIAAALREGPHGQRIFIARDKTIWPESPRRQKLAREWISRFSKVPFPFSADRSETLVRRLAPRRRRRRAVGKRV
jgi:hypothetical protein